MGRHQQALPLQRQRLLAQRHRLAEEATAQGRQAFQRVVAAAVAIGPVVVAGGVDKGAGKALEVLPLALVLVVGAGGRAVLEVAHVDGERQAQVVDAVDQAAVCPPGQQVGTVGHVAQGDEVEGLGLGCRLCPQPRRQRGTGQRAQGRQRAPAAGGGHHRTRMPGCAPAPGASTKMPGAAFSSAWLAASTMPSLMPNFILRGARLATITVSWPTSCSGA